MVQIANTVFSLLAIISQISVVLILVSLFWKNKATNKIIIFFGTRALFFAFLVALVSTLGSLFYSEIVHYEPCKLCWYQRILMYPQVLLFGMAYIRKEKWVANYGILFSTIGAIIASYHYLLQRGAVQEILPCSAVGYSVSCAQKFVMTYGYITIPLMALSAFLLIISLMLAAKKSGK